MNITYTSIYNPFGKMNFSGKMDNKCVFSLHFLRIPGISSHFRNSSFSISADCFRVVQPNRAMTGEYQSFRKFRQGNKPFLHSSGKRYLTIDDFLTLILCKDSREGSSHWHDFSCMYVQILLFKK